MLQQVTASPTLAAVVAFYGEPLPHEIRSRGYLQAVCIAKLTALRTMLGEPAIAWHAPVAARAVTAPAPRPKATKAAKRLTAEQFFDAYQIARRSVSSAIGLHWVIQGHARWATLPAGWRSFTGPRGGKVRLPKDCRVPAAEFWPGGVMPPELVIAEPSTPRTPWIVGTDGIERHPYIVHVMQAMAEQREADRPWRERREMRERIRAARSARRECFRMIRNAYFGQTVRDLAPAKLVKIRVELMADLRRYRETGSFAEPVEQIDALAEAEFGVDTERELAGC